MFSNIEAHESLFCQLFCDGIILKIGVLIGDNKDMVQKIRKYRSHKNPCDSRVVGGRKIQLICSTASIYLFCLKVKKRVM